MSLPQSILITGTSSGIGRETALLFAEHGWQVIACTRDGQEHPAHSQIRGMAMDIDSAASIDACFDTLQKEGSVPAVIVNNAAWGVRVPFDAMRDDEMHGMLQTNVLGTMRVTQAWLKIRAAEEAGMMIVVSSFAGKAGLLYHSVYCATKWAIEGWAEALHYELAPRGISVKIVEPLNRIETAFFEKARDREKERTLSPQTQERYAAYKEVSDKKEASLLARDVATTLYRAATDGKKRLRYPVGRGLFLPAFLLLRAVWPSLAISVLERRYRQWTR